MSNRVEELESTVRQLRADVDGLTEELVETRERLRQLEETQEERDEPTAGSAHAERVDAGRRAEPEGASGSGTERDPDTTSDPAETDADAGTDTDADTDDADEADEANDVDDTDDIIVA